MSRTWLGFLCQRSGSRSGRGSKSYLSGSPGAAEANLARLHGEMEQDGRVCRARELGSCAQGQGRSRVRGRVVPKICAARGLLRRIW